MKEVKFRTLRADEIEVRPQQIKNGVANMLLYIDSRAVVNLLNETVGNLNWQMEFYEVNNQTVGKLGIYDDERQMWVWKSDVGSESNVEATKGLFSDTYKRSLARWGVCELYSAPKITIPDDGYKCTGYKVLEIAYDDNRNITYLSLGNKFGKMVKKYTKQADGTWEEGPEKGKVYSQQATFRMSTPTESPKPYNVDSTVVGEVTNGNREAFTSYCTILKQCGQYDLGEIKKFYNFYEKKLDTWKGNIDARNLWQRWLSTAKSA